jgi:hypothetical protein
MRGRWKERFGLWLLLALKRLNTYGRPAIENLTERFSEDTSHLLGLSLTLAEVALNEAEFIRDAHLQIVRSAATGAYPASVALGVSGVSSPKTAAHSQEVRVAFEKGCAGGRTPSWTDDQE